MRKRALFKSVDADIKIMDWFQANPEKIDPAKSQYVDYYNAVDVDDFRVGRQSYGNTDIAFSISYPDARYPTSSRLSMPIESKTMVSIASHKDVAHKIVYPELLKLWESDVPTFNRKCDNWFWALLDNDYLLNRWPWIKESRESAIRRISNKVRMESLKEIHQTRAFEEESGRALDRLIDLQKTFPHVPPGHWHNLVDLAMVHKIHT